MLGEGLNIQEALNKAPDTFKLEGNKSISAKDVKSLPPAKEDVKNDIEN